MTIDLEPDEDWLQESREAIHNKIERAFCQFENGEGLTPEESVARLDAKKMTLRGQP